MPILFPFTRNLPKAVVYLRDDNRRSIRTSSCQARKVPIHLSGPCPSFHIDIWSWCPCPSIHIGIWSWCPCPTFHTDIWSWNSRQVPQNCFSSSTILAYKFSHRGLILLRWNKELIQSCQPLSPRMSSFPFNLQIKISPLAEAQPPLRCFSIPRHPFGVAHLAPSQHRRLNPASETPFLIGDPSSSETGPDSVQRQRLSKYTR